MPPSFAEVEARLLRERAAARDPSSCYVTPMGRLVPRHFDRVEALTKREFKRVEQVLDPDFTLLNQSRLVPPEFPCPRPVNPSPLREAPIHEPAFSTVFEVQFGDEEPEPLEKQPDIRYVGPPPTSPEDNKYVECGGKNVFVALGAPELATKISNTVPQVDCSSIPISTTPTVPILVSPVPQPRPVVKPNKNIVHSFAGHLGVCICNGGDFECTIFFSKENGSLNMCYGRPPHVCRSVPVEEDLKKVREMLDSVFSSKILLNPAASAFVRHYLWMCFKRDHEIIWNPCVISDGSRCMQVIPLEPCEFIMPGSDKLASFYAYARQEIDAMACDSMPSPDVLQEFVFKKWPYARKYFVGCVFGRSQCLDIDPPELPGPAIVNPKALAAFFHALLYCSNIEWAGLDVPDVTTLSCLTAIAAHEGLRFRVCADFNSISTHRVLPFESKRSFDTSDLFSGGEWGKSPFEIILSTGSISYPPEVPLRFKHTFSATQRPQLREYPALTFFDGVPDECILLYPNVARGGPVKKPKYYGNFFLRPAALEPDKKEMLKVLLPIMYDIRVGLGFRRWALAFYHADFSHMIRAVLTPPDVNFALVRRPPAILFELRDHQAYPIGMVGAGIVFRMFPMNFDHWDWGPSVDPNANG